MKKQSGVSLITLIVTMMIMLILVGIVGKFSLDNIKKANESKRAREFAGIRDFVVTMQLQIDNEDFENVLKSNDDLVLDGSLAHIVADGKLLDSELNAMLDVNAADIDAKYKYFYLPATGKYFSDPNFAIGGMTVSDVESDYIVNFYTGTVISLANDYPKIDGVIKGLDEILLEIGE